MGFPKINNSSVKTYLDRAGMVKQTAEQIIKDFGLFGIDIHFSGSINNAYDELHEQLVEQVTYLLEINSQKLLSVLYQIDVNEKKMLDSQNDFPQYDHVELIAHEIIVRELKKVVTRDYFRNNP